MHSFWSLQFDEEFTARQEAQAELQKRDEKIKELETEIQQLRGQVRKQCRLDVTMNLVIENYLVSQKEKCDQKQTFSLLFTDSHFS